jgi:7 transmembrane sweet-taste receptor of 3 GCPR
MAAAKKMKRIKIRRNNLFGIVSAFTLLVVIGLIVWTVLDPPLPLSHFFLEDEVNDDGETIVTIQQYCSSESNYWLFGAMIIHIVVLLWAAVLAFQTRRTPQRFRESTVLAAVIYAQVAFVAFRIILLAMPPDMVSPDVNTGLTSLLTALDCITTLCIYFAPKLFLYNKEASGHGTSAPQRWPPTESAAPQQWPPADSTQGPSLLCDTQANDNLVSHASESEPNGNESQYHPQKLFAHAGTLTNPSRETELLREEKDIATKLLLDLQSDKQALQQQVHLLSVDKSALEGRVGILEEENALLKGHDNAVEPPQGLQK